MTTREFMEQIINSNLSAEITAYAEAEIAKLDAKNEKRRNTPTKAQLANEDLKVAVLEMLGNEAKVASEIGKALEVSTQKASSLLQALEKEGKVKSADIKVKGKGSVKGYTLVG